MGFWDFIRGKTKQEEPRKQIEPITEIPAIRILLEDDQEMNFFDLQRSKENPNLITGRIKKNKVEENLTEYGAGYFCIEIAPNMSIADLKSKGILKALIEKGITEIGTQKYYHLGKITSDLKYEIPDREESQRICDYMDSQIKRFPIQQESESRQGGYLGRQQLAKELQKGIINQDAFARSEQRRRAEIGLTKYAVHKESGIDKNRKQVEKISRSYKTMDKTTGNPLFMEKVTREGSIIKNEKEIYLYSAYLSSIEHKWDANKLDQNGQWEAKPVIFELPEPLENLENRDELDENQKQELEKVIDLISLLGNNPEVPLSGDSMRYIGRIKKGEDGSYTIDRDKISSAILQEAVKQKQQETKQELQKMKQEYQTRDQDGIGR